MIIASLRIESIITGGEVVGIKGISVWEVYIPQELEPNFRNFMG